MTIPDKIEARNNKPYYSKRLWITGVPALAVISIFLAKGLPHTDNFGISKGTNFSMLPAIIITLIFPAYFLYNYLNTKIKLVIDDDGIWSPKTKNIQWTKIWYFSTTEHKYRGGISYFLFIRLKDEFSDNEQPLRINIGQLDKSYKELRNVIQLYASRNNINDLGHEEK